MENYQTKYKVACKTGSTDYDNLIVAYNPNILINGWVGYDDNRKIENSSVQIEDLIGKLDTVNNSAESATVVVKEEYDVIGEVKRQFDDIQEELDTVAATSEENASMVAEIGNNIVNQTDYVMKLSGSIDSLKESSKKLEEHFNE